MENLTLHKKLVKYLEELPMKKKDLVCFLSDILCIEKESVYRRLNDKIIFTLSEFEIIVEKFNISIDRLLNKSQVPTFFPYELIEPLSIPSIDILIDEILYNKNILKKICINPLSMGQVVDFIPLEFFSCFEKLTKFMYFKWGYYFLESKFFTTYSEWEVPEEIIAHQYELLDLYVCFNEILYIWDRSIIPNLLNEILFLYRIHILSKEDASLILKDLHDFLDYMENLAKRTTDFKIINPEAIEIYISNSYIGGTTVYFNSEISHYTYYKNQYMPTIMYEDLENFNKIHNWINSMKKVSTLISGTGEIERRIFFDEQHRILDMMNIA